MKDWSDYEKTKPYPPFTEDDFADAPGQSSEPFRREEWERKAAGTVDEISRAHDEPDAPHAWHRHPWCESCILRDEDYERDTFSPRRPTSDEVEYDEYCKLLDTASYTARERIRWWMTKHRGELPIEQLIDSSGLDGEYLDRHELNDLPTPEPLIEGIMPRHSYGILRGRDGTYKSFVALDWALCLATGKPWQGRHSERVKVLYVAGEGAYGLARRIDAWEYAWGCEIPSGQLTVRKSALSLYRPGAAYKHLLEHVERQEYGLVVIDTLRRVSGAADGNGSEMGAVVDNLDQIKRATADGSVLVIAHTDKSDSDSRGYSGIEDDADFVWHAKRDEQILRLENTKQKDGPDSMTYILQATPTLESLTLSAGSAESVSTTESQLRILDTMRSSFRDGAHSGQLHETSGLPKTTFYRALSELKDAGHLVNSGSHKRPFYELADSPESHKVPSDDTPSDLGKSHRSHEVPPSVEQVPQVPPPLRVGPGTNGGTKAGIGADLSA